MGPPTWMEHSMHLPGRTRMAHEASAALCFSPSCRAPSCSRTARPLPPPHLPPTASCTRSKPTNLACQTASNIAFIRFPLKSASNQRQTAAARHQQHNVHEASPTLSRSVSSPSVWGAEGPVGSRSRANWSWYCNSRLALLPACASLRLQAWQTSTGAGRGRWCGIGGGVGRVGGGGVGRGVVGRGAVGRVVQQTAARAA